MFQENIKEKSEQESVSESFNLITRGIAHDFNNILTAILGNISLAKMDLEDRKFDPDDEIFELLIDAEDGIEIAKKLTQQLLTFAKEGKPSKVFFFGDQISDLIRQSVRFSLSGSDMSCNYSIDDDLWDINVDSSQIGRVIHNIVINAMQAMPIGGSIDLLAENVNVIDLKNNKANFGFLIKPGNYIKISVIDFGIGISDEDYLHIFEPLYRGKNKFVGKGMGLTVALSIIKQHNGYIDLISQEDHGTSVFIYLPAVESEKSRIKPVISKDLFHGHGIILIMDDELIVRKVLSKMLNQIGYDVFSVIDGNQAIKTYKEFREKNTPFDAAILDLTIKGGMGGKKAIGHILDFDPNAKIIASSGYTTSEVMKEFKKFGFSGILVKPYKIKELSHVLYNLLLKEI
jgi:nitrogen-specific signal transduction histidine kinase/CheY-like chemotaxis protein